MKPTSIYGADYIDDAAIAQFNSAMEQDYSVQGALMPDAHLGYSLPIGAVVATEGVVVPAWVGYDIGCGMCALRLDVAPETVRDNAEAIFEDIYAAVPVGFNVHQHPKDTDLDPKELSPIGLEMFEKRKGFRALGTLGGGNHFIEIGADEFGFTWTIVHSGSRGVGHGIATAYMRLASGDGKAREGHYPLEIDSDLGASYINDMGWVLAFAMENRQRITDVVPGVLGGGHYDFVINRNHNHAELVDGRWIHRKGATQAGAGDMGVIPGNMRDGSFIVRGLGNPESMCSSSHGAGRKLGRKEARRTLVLAEFISAMGSITAKVGEDTLDESPAAYKDIYKVMDLQVDLVEYVRHVTPIVNVKG